MDSGSDKLLTVGRSFPRVDAREKATGQTRFLPDITVDRMVHAYPVTSAVPYGKLVSIDDADAQKVEGFLRLVTAADIPGINQVGVIIEDQPLFADEVVRYAGDVVALVVAETDEAAREAASKVKVDIQPYDPILSIEASRAAKKQFLHENNIACQHQGDKGDVDAGFGQADVIVEADFKTPYQEHFYLEPQGCIAIPGQHGGMEILGSLQCPFYVQKAVSKALHLPFSRVRVEQTPLGGAFGGKEDVPSEVCARAAVAALAVGRPVKVVYRRRDDVQMTSKRHPIEMHYRVGVTKDGKLVAADVVLNGNAGAYATLSSVVSYRSTMQAMGPYVIPNVRVRSTHWYTNLPPTGAFRGFGSPQAAFGHERMMDLIAEKLGMDPVELRLRNVLKPGEETQTGHRLEASVGIEETILKSRDASGWNSKRSARQNDDRFLRGIGIAATHYGNCLGAAGWAMDGAGAKIQIHRDGSVSVAFGLVEMGQGALTVVSQMTAEALGIDPARITVMPTETTSVPDSGPSVASRNVVMTGNAIRDAVDKLLPVLLDATAEMFECEAKDVAIRDDRVHCKKKKDTIGFDKLADYLYISNRPMDTLGWWHVPRLTFDPKHGYGEAYFTYSYSTHIAEVAVDRLTGLVTVEKI
ncbi:MAG: xanthine dehydrogenase family protein molybdopterin-binding subunit, partial [bacterium]